MQVQPPSKPDYTVKDVFDWLGKQIITPERAHDLCVQYYYLTHVHGEVGDQGSTHELPH